MNISNVCYTSKAQSKQKEVYDNKDTQKENIHKKSIEKIMMIAGTRRRLLYERDKNNR